MRERDVPYECGAFGAPEVHRPPEKRQSPHRRYHHGAEPWLHAPRVPGCGGERMGEAADHRDANPIDAGLDPGTERATRGEPVLPALPLRPRRRPKLG